MVILIASPSLYVFADESNNIDAKLEKLTNNSPQVALQKTASMLLLDLSPHQRFEVLMTRAKLHHKLDEFELSIKVLIEADNHALSYGLIEERAQITKYFGIIYYYQGRYAKAVLAYKQAFEYYESTKQFLKQAHLWNNIALVNAAMGDIEQAVSNYQQAQSLYVNYGSEIDKTDVKFNIAGLYNRLHRYDLAIMMFKSVIKSRMSRQDFWGVALAHGDIGISYFNTGEYELARSFYTKSLNYFQQEKSNYQAASQLENLAEVLFRMGMVEESIDYARQCISVARQSGNNHAFSTGLYSLAMSLFSQGKYDRTNQYLSTSNEMALEMEDTEQLTKNELLMSLVYAAQNNQSKALESLSAYQLANKKLQNKKLATKLLQYQAKLESENLQQEVNSLIQKDKLQSLKLATQNQQYAFGLGGFLLIILTAFFLYKSRTERNLKIRLSEKVKLRTAALELLMENLRQTNDVKNQFLANMSHEIRTPLTAVIGQAEAIMDGHVDAEFIHKEVEIIYNNSNHLLTLLNDILDLSRIEANKLELNLKRHDIHRIVDEVQNVFTKQAKKKHLTFSVINELPSPFLMDVDTLRLKQILINLCSNAIKFTSQGYVTLRVSRHAEHVVFEVEDSGIGLNKLQLDKIFHHFTQGDNSINRRFGGSGLGLCLSQQLALMMGSHIQVESEIDRGSKFSFSLLEPMFNEASVKLIEVTHEPISYVNLLSGTILLADDHDDNRRLTKRLLEVLGFDVVTATNGFEVIEQYNNSQPQLILLDIQMPEMDGIETLKVLKDQGVTIPILALTANAMSHEIESYLTLGFDDYISKPIVRDRFIKLLAFYLNQTPTCEQEERIKDVPYDDLKNDFEVTLTAEINTITQLLTLNDYVSLSNAAHRLSGAAAMFGYADIAELSARVEKSVKDKQLLQTQLLTEQLLMLLSQTINK